MLKVLLLIFISLSLIGDEYAFDMGEIEPEPYEYSGYLRVDDKVHYLDEPEDEYQNYLHLEALFNFTYFYDKFRFKTSLMATYDHIDNKLSENDFPIYELYSEYKLNTNHAFLLGKESLRWGKEYYYNPIAFFD